MSELEAPGWRAIDEALGRVYPGQVPHQFASQVPYELHGQSPLPAVSVWEAGSPRSWHYVSYGLSELFEKQSPVAAVSGFGFELTLRLPRADDEHRPPGWGVSLLQALGHHCLTERAGFDSGHCVDLGGSMTPEHDSPLRGLLLLPDPMLGRISTPHGSVLFLQAVGVTVQELAAFREMSLEAKVAAMGELDPSGLTDPARACWSEHPEHAKTLLRWRLLRL